MRWDALVMQNPVQILPDGTIIAGHQRVEAARLLGWDEIDARVRHDLAEDPAAAEEALVADNLFSRQMGPLDIARTYKALGRGKGSSQGDMRDQIGLRLGMSGRNLDRYLRVLEHAPQEVQDAVSANTPLHPACGSTPASDTSWTLLASGRTGVAQGQTCGCGNRCHEGSVGLP